MISIHNLTRRYGDTVAVQGVTTEIGRGEIVGLLGHNGAGKTTVMKILTGYLQATEGTVTIDGLDIADHRTQVKQRIGYLPENAPLYDHMLVQAYLVMMARLRGVPEDRLAQQVGEAVVATGLQDRLRAPIDTLSKGLRQRVGIAQAIVHRPDVLVLDEPTNGLDPMQIHAIRDLIRRLGRHTTILLSTHILQEIEAVCDRVLILIDGHLVQDSPLPDLLDSRRVRLTLDPGAPGVEEALSAVPGVQQVTPAGAGTYLLTWQGDAAPVPAILETAHAQRWTVRSIAPEIRTLETVFQELQTQHIAERGGVA